LRVLGIAPQVKDDQIILQMELGGDSRDRALELARRMEKSNVFRDARIVTESAGQTQTGQTDIMHFQMTAEYVPGQTLPKPETETGTPEASNAATSEQIAHSGGSR
jgi:hypothetical protein